MSETLLQLEDVVVHHRTDPTGFFGLWGAKPVRTLDGVSLTITRGETLGIMGGSGAGKTTLSEVACLRRPIERGRILLQGEDVRKLDRKRAQRRLQMVRQDARETLELDQSVQKQLSAKVREFGLPDGEGRIHRALTQVGLPPEEFLDRTPAAMSGGQQQRLAIARALVLNPLMIALDEPVSGVDPHLQLDLMRLLERVQREQGIAYLLISHDVKVISRLAHRVAVFHDGKLFELGPTQKVMGDPAHPYSRLFYGKDGLLPAEEDRAGRTRQGCPWAPHCALVTDRCRTESPALRELNPGHAVACHEVAR
ncbi:MAG: ATP-binding cassette domain-containing protein [Bacillota bacterium]